MCMYTPVVGLAPATLEFFVVECASDSPYTYSSSTLAHRFPDERTPIEATPGASFSDTAAELVLGVGLGLGFGSHSSSHAPLLLATHTIFLSEPSRSLVRDGQTSPHKPRLVVPHSTCPSLSP